MRILVKSSDEVMVLLFEGRFDVQSSSDAEAQLTYLIDEGKTKILVNLERLEYISSAGLRVLLATSKRLKVAGENLRICSPNRVVLEVFEISGFTAIFEMFESESEALESF